MIKVVMAQLVRGFGGPLRFDDATRWRFSDRYLVIAGPGDEKMAEIPIENVLFVEREEYEKEEAD